MLAGGGPADVVELTVALAAAMLAGAGVTDVDPAEHLANGRAMDVWNRMIEAQGGDPRADLPTAAHTEDVVAETDGVLTELDAMAVGLAAWRLGDCASAADAFGRAAGSAQNLELTAAAYYWSSRSLVRCRQPERAAEQLRGAARLDETLYGMLAREQLGQDLPGGKRTADFNLADWQRLRDEPNVRTAVALAEIALLGGLSMGHHVATALLVPGCALFVLGTAPRRALQPRAIGAALCGAALGLSVYLYLPLRAAAGMPSPGRCSRRSARTRSSTTRRC